MDKLPNSCQSSSYDCPIEGNHIADVAPKNDFDSPALERSLPSPSIIVPTCRLPISKVKKIPIYLDKT